MTDDDISIFFLFPTEVLLYIFTFLTPKQLAVCRVVCSRWLEIVDSLTKSEILWQKYCKEDFTDIYQLARYKSKPGLTWHQLYRSLTLWSKLSQTRELRDEFASASHSSDQIQDFQILRHGIIGVHTRGAIVYYNIKTLQQSNQGKVTGSYLKYVENDDVILVLSHNLHLFVVRKFVCNTQCETNVTFDNVKTFILVNRDVYYVTLTDDVFLCRLDSENLRSNLLCSMSNGVMCLGYNKNQLHILTFERNIYSIIGQELRCVFNLEDSRNLMHELRKYNFLEHLDWRVYFQWLYVLNHTVPPDPMRDIIIVRTYGQVVFVGSNWGVLRIYYAPYYNDEFDIFNSEPIKQYNFMERYDCPVLSMCPIIQIDVIEGEDSHMLIVAMPKKIAILNFIHSTKRTAAVAMLPYNEVQGVKILKISDLQL